VKGRDDSGSLQDVIFSKYYNLLRGSIDTPKKLLIDLFTNVYPGRKGTQDPALTLSTSTNFESHGISTPDGVFNWDRISFWQALEALCQAIEGHYSAEPFFIDYWTDENDVTHVTQTGELSLAIDVGGYGGDYVKVRDWTLDALPIKNDIWFWGNNKAGVLPLSIDATWCKYNNRSVSDPWTKNTAQYFSKLWSNPASPDTHMEITNGTNGIHIHFGSLGLQNAVIGGSPTGEPTPFLQGPNAPPYFGWEIDMRSAPFGPNTSDFAIFRRGPLGHLNFSNNDVTDESMGEINQINCSVRATGQGESFNLCVVLIDGQNNAFADAHSAAAISAMLAYNQLLMPASKVSVPVWTTMSFPIGPSAGATIQTTAPYDFNLNLIPPFYTPGFFDWSDIVRIQFIVPQSSILGAVMGDLDIDFDGLSFTKPLVAHGKPIPTDSIHTGIVTDATVGGLVGYETALFRANQYAAGLRESQSYVDYMIVGRPDLQVGHTFTAEGKEVLIRSSITGATKLGGYVTSVQAWKPLP
jgi:hypothetical protein